MLFCVYVQPRPRADRVVLEFKLDTNPLVDIWLDCIRSQVAIGQDLRREGIDLEYLQGCSSFTSKESHAKALAAVELSRTQLGLSPDLDINALHLLFHQHYEDDHSVNLEWDLLNRRIHHLEEQERNLLKNTQKKTGFNCVLVDPIAGITEQRPIPPELRHYWSHMPRSGELFLGYYTIGKTIYNCFNDNDVECVKQGMVRQQQEVSTEFLCYWGNYGSSFNPIRQQQANLVRQQKIAEWLAQNKLEEYVDLAQPEYQYHGMPRLGEYTGTMNLEEINQLLSSGKIVFTELFD